MQNTDIMINNLFVKYHSKYHQVPSLTRITLPSEFDFPGLYGIPFTPNVIKKIGLLWGSLDFKLIPNRHYTIALFSSDVDIAHIHELHTLQNLHYLLTNMELPLYDLSIEDIDLSTIWQLP